MLAMLSDFSVVTEAAECDDRFCCDGGSYYQPTITISTKNGTVVVIDDSSCGDFGSRIDATVKLPGGKEFHASWGSMEPERLFSDIPAWLWSVICQVWNATGYLIPLEIEVL